MTYQQAVTIRTMQLQGYDVAPALLARAIAVIQSTRTSTPKPKNKGTRQQVEPAGKDPAE